VKVSAVFSISHTAVAFGIRGSVMAYHFLRAAARGPTAGATTLRQIGSAGKGDMIRDKLRVKMTVR
jgi:hypothetical protein